MNRFVVKYEDRLGERLASEVEASEGIICLGRDSTSKPGFLEVRLSRLGECQEDFFITFFAELLRLYDWRDVQAWLLAGMSLNYMQQGNGGTVQ